jgi:hypothetical protein
MAERRRRKQRLAQQAEPVAPPLLEVVDPVPDEPSELDRLLAAYRRFVAR